jgi:hypothetical protein
VGRSFSFFYGFGLVACSNSELILKFLILLDIWYNFLDGGQAVARPLNYTEQHNTEKRPYIQVSSGVRTHDPRFRAATVIDVYVCVWYQRRISVWRGLRLHVIRFT